MKKEKYKNLYRRYCKMKMEFSPLMSKAWEKNLNLLDEYDENDFKNLIEVYGLSFPNKIDELKDEYEIALTLSILGY